MVNEKVSSLGSLAVPLLLQVELTVGVLIEHTGGVEQMPGSLMVAVWVQDELVASVKVMV